MTITLTSPSFADQEIIPNKFTCDGEDISPELNWSSAPTNGKSWVLIVDDPDAPIGNWDHWLLFNIPANITNLPENIAKHIKDFPTPTKIGKNSWGLEQYGGPCPPDREHRYFFKLYALDQMLDLPNGAIKGEIEQAMNGHIIGHTTLIGRYNRPHNTGNF